MKREKIIDIRQMARVRRENRGKGKRGNRKKDDLPRNWIRSRKRHPVNFGKSTNINKSRIFSMPLLQNKVRAHGGCAETSFSYFPKRLYRIQFAPLPQSLVKVKFRDKFIFRLVSLLYTPAGIMERLS